MRLSTDKRLIDVDNRHLMLENAIDKQRRHDEQQRNPNPRCLPSKVDLIENQRQGYTPLHCLTKDKKNCVENPSNCEEEKNDVTKTRILVLNAIERVTQQTFWIRTTIISTVS